MGATAALLIAASVALHVTWNAISKSVRPTPAFFLLASAISAAALTPIVLWHHDIALPTLQLVLPALVPTGIFAAFYNVALARAYQSGDLSLVYPLARSLGPVGIALASVAIGRGEMISAGCGAGIALIALGSVILPLRRFDELRPGRYRSPAFLWAVLTATATVGYTLLDDQALRWIRAESSLNLDTTGQSLLYAAMQAWATTLSLCAYVVFVPRERQSIALVLRQSGRQALAVGIFGYASYILVLASMAFVDDVTYVAAFRQLGVPLALLVGLVILREPLSAPKLVGGALCSVGLLLIAIS